MNYINASVDTHPFDLNEEVAIFLYRNFIHSILN